MTLSVIPRLLISFAFASVLCGQDLNGHVPIHYKGVMTIPKHGSRRLTIKYDDLYPGVRMRGGCSWKDETQPGSYMPIVESDKNHQVIEAPRGHIIAWECWWNVPLPKGEK
jgi:hypothetical protein